MHLYIGMLLLKFGKGGAEGERLFTLSGDCRYLSWKSKLFSMRFGRLNDSTSCDVNIPMLSSKHFFMLYFNCCLTLL